MGYTSGVISIWPESWFNFASNPRRRPRVLVLYGLVATLFLVLIPGLLRGGLLHGARGRVLLFFQRSILTREDGPADVTIVVDPAVQYQILDGFGQAEPSLLVYPDQKTLSDSLRAAAVEKAYHQVGINMGIAGSLIESPGDYSQRQNDNGDPFTINWAGFSTFYVDAAKQYLIDQAGPYGFKNYYLGAEAPNVRWGSPWLADIRTRDYGAYLDETAEQVLANVTYWKNTYGEELLYYQLGNEQLSGNQAMINPDLSGYGAVDPVQQMVDITKRAGDRLQRAGFVRTRFMVGTEETEEVSLRIATAILSDPLAARYVGAIGYHSYPYGEGYSSIPFILSTSGAGAPDRDRVAVRNQIRDLGKKYNVKVWMTENSNAGDPRSYDDFRARAIQIHDEFLYAEASAYFGENAIWDLASQRLHFADGNLYGVPAEGTVVLINNDTGALDITGIGYAIGHYARWIKPGAFRIDATASDPLVQVTAFRDATREQAVLVLINNSRIAKNVTVSLKGLALAGNINGEQSTSSAYWKSLPAFPPAGPSGFTITLPDTSVTSLAVSWDSNVTPQLSPVSAASLTGPAVAVDSLATALVSGLPADTVIAPSDLPPPTSLGGINVTAVDNAGTPRQAPLLFVSPRQINFVVPSGMATGPATLSVTGAGGVLAAGQLTIVTVAPGLFSANGDGQGVAAAQVQRVRADGSQTIGPVYQCGSSRGSCRSTPLDLFSGDQVYLLFYGTGIRNRSDIGNVGVTIGGVAAQVLYAGPHPTLPAIDQLNVLAPRLRGVGDVDVIFTVDGKTANVVKIGVL